MKNPDQLTLAPSEQTDFKKVTKQEKIARLISRYIETRVIGKNKSAGEDEEKEIKEYYASMDPKEKADTLYSKLMAYMLDKQVEAENKKEAKIKGEKFEQEESDPYLISEIKTLYEDKDVKKLIPDSYGEARVDEHKLRSSELAMLWQNISKEINEMEEKYKKLEQDLHLKRISGHGQISSAESRMARLAEKITAGENRKNEIESLKGLDKLAENTDVAANIQYEKLKQYKKQLDEGFVWLPSRKKIHRETVSAILNHRWPVLIGEAGTGKSDQADAAAIELTGNPPTEIECESITGEKQLIKDVAIDPKTGGSYEEYSPLMRAYTGYDNSAEKEPAVKTGRIARFDESGRLGSKAYAIIKKVRQKKQGDDFYGRKVLSGAGAIWTTNPPGQRYPGRYAPDPALRRELAEIKVLYPEMSKENPELYEFMLTALFDENNQVRAAKNELAPAYERKEIPEDTRNVLDDGNVIVAKDEIIEDITDKKHGALWRFAGAIKALQESFVYGNSETEKYPDTLLRFKEDDDGNIEIINEGGELLTLSTSTVTLGEISSWMSGFNERRQKQDPDFRVDTFTEWLNFKIKTYLKQADKADKAKIEAIFKHFHFLEDSLPDVKQAKPLTPKEIGYLSPRVPRPVHIEKPVRAGEKQDEAEQDQGKEAEEHKTDMVVLENGKRVLMKINDFTSALGGKELLKVALGRKFIVNNEKFSFAGVVEDEKSEHNGKPIGRLASEEELHRVFSEEELDFGIMEELKEKIGATGIDDLREDLMETWKQEGCEAGSGEFVF